jgi:hypothetical protein
VYDVPIIVNYIIVTQRDVETEIYLIFCGYFTLPAEYNFSKVKEEYKTGIVWNIFPSEVGLAKSV